MKFGVEYDLKDGIGTEVTATATDDCDVIEIVALGGKQGKQITKLHIEEDTKQLIMTMILVDHNVSAKRIFEAL